MRPTASLRVVPIMLLMILLAPTVRAEFWYENYDKAEKALASQNWKEAADQLLKAIEQRPEPGAQIKTYGMNFISYHPYLKLGIAYYNLGNYDAALQAFDTEEQRGAVAKSATDLGNLRAFRKLAQDAKLASGAGDKDRLARAVAEGLANARSLETGGKLEEALAAAGKALAAAPDNLDAKATMKRLQDAVAEQTRQREADSRFTKLMDDARSAIAAGKYEEASATLNQALSIKSDSGASSLLSLSQGKLRERIEASQSAENTKKAVSEGLAEAARLEREAKPADALQALQRVLAVEPGNVEATVLQNRITRAQAETGAAQGRADEIAKLLEDGVGLLQQGLAEQAAAAFNKVLALEPANAAAKANVVQAFNLMNRSILGGAPLNPKLIPMIVLPGVDGAVVSDPYPNFAGSILDDGPQVRISYSLDGALSGSASTLSGTRTGSLYRFDFKVPIHLRPGSATLKVTAIDLDNLSGEQEYRVRYARPWQRSPWTYAAAAALILGIGGTLQGLKRRQRNALLRRRFNPYVAGAPILENELFIGREPLLARVLQTIHNNSILLYGERRIGKTSFQHHLKKRLTQLHDPDYEFFPVYIDLQGTPQEKFFATLAMEIFHELAPVLETPPPERDLREEASYTYESFVRDVRTVLKQLRERSTKKVKLALLIDEVDELNDYDPRINQKLRSLFMKSFAENLVAVVSGVGIKKRWESEGSPWYNFFEEIEVRPFTSQDAVELIERPIRGVFQMDDGVVERIVQLTDAKPYLIQKLCIALVNRMHEAKRRRITVADVDAVGRPAEA